MQLLLGLGGNLQDPPQHFRTALTSLAGQHEVLSASRLYRSEPEGPPQPRYWNMAALVELAIPLRDFLTQCQALEAAAGRQRDPCCRQAPRPLDIDLLLARALVHRGPTLVLPHPALARRAFALIPAAELVPDWVHPWAHRTVAELARQVHSADPAAVELALPTASWPAVPMLLSRR